MQLACTLGSFFALVEGGTMSKRNIIARLVIYCFLEALLLKVQSGNPKNPKNNQSLLSIWLDNVHGQWIALDSQA